MAGIFALNGSYTLTPGAGYPSGDATINAPLNESLVLKNETYQQFDLTSDSPYSVPLNGLSAAHVIAIKVVGGKVKMRLTTTDGSQQAIPVDTFGINFLGAAPATAIDLTRPTGVLVTVRLFLGERA